MFPREVEMVLELTGVPEAKCWVEKVLEWTVL